ncbi:MAG: glutamine synthetase III, partial [Opitutales bacterium]|nr:glutamine synthetase III [Opitutales bacterium]
MSNLRLNAVETASNRKVTPVTRPEAKLSEYYGCKVFDRKAMARYLSKETFVAITSAMDQGEPISRELATHIAPAMRMWAMENGATHYTHWFHPLTDGTAEKHDAAPRLPHIAAVKILSKNNCKVNTGFRFH